MNEELLKERIKQSKFNKLPKWLRVLIFVLSLITIVYWLGVAIYKLLCLIRVIGAFIFEERNYWMFLCCILILIIGSLLIAQFSLGLDPFGKFVEWIGGIDKSIKGFLIQMLS